MATKLMTMTELAVELGVDRRRVWAWNSRRDRNGFPAPAGEADRIYRAAPVATWDLDKVREWYASYDPSDWPNRPRANKRQKTPA